LIRTPATYSSLVQPRGGWLEKQTHKLEGDPESIRQKGRGTPDISESGGQMSLNSNPVAAGQEVLLFAHR